MDESFKTETLEVFPTSMPVENVIDHSIFINNVLIKISSFNIGVGDESTDFEKIFMSILDFVNSIEFYTIFSKRTYKHCEEYLFSHPDITSIIMQSNMFLQGYMSAKPPYGKSVFHLFQGFSNSVSPTRIMADTDSTGRADNKKYLDEEDSTIGFYRQISDNPTFALHRAFDTWQKVFILMQYHYNDIVEYIRSVKSN